jgi:hypothetical protein
LFNRRAHASENLRPVPQKDFCNTIPSEADIIRLLAHVRFVPQAEIILASLGWIHSALMFAALMIGHRFSTSAL